ncbi:MAG: winged helix-turn-helix domain-containing protein [Thermoproteota archaeon]
MFETLAHETRIKILKALENQQLSFAELKRYLGIESSGNLQHHIIKLGDLIKQTEEGKYALSDDGREALRILNTIEVMHKGPLNLHSRGDSTPTRHNLISLSLLLLVATVSLLFAILQHLQLKNSIQLYGNISFNNGKVQIGGKEYYYLILNTPDLQELGEITFHEVRFSYQRYLKQLAIRQFSINNSIGFPSHHLQRYIIEIPPINESIKWYRGIIELVLVNGNNVSLIIIEDQIMNNISDLSSPPDKILILGNVSNILLPVERFKIKFDDGAVEFIYPANWPQNANAPTNVGFTTYEKPRAGVFKIGPNTFILLVSVMK